MAGCLETSYASIMVVYGSCLRGFVFLYTLDDSLFVCCVLGGYICAGSGE